MLGSAFLHHHGHDCVLVRFPALLVGTDNLVNPNIADEVPHDKNEIGCDQTTSIDIAHRIAGRERFFGCQDGYNLDP